MLKIRLQRRGRKKAPFFKIVIADAKSPRDGKFIEAIGSYNPLLGKESDKRVLIEQERVAHWLAAGAKPTDTVSRLLHNAKLIEQPNLSIVLARKKKANLQTTEQDKA
jgi:small subunit ribosomal protein S16